SSKNAATPPLIGARNTVFIVGPPVQVTRKCHGASALIIAECAREDYKPTALCSLKEKRRPQFAPHQDRRLRGAPATSIEVDHAVAGRLVQDRPPDLVRSLMLRRTKADGRTQAEVEPMDALQTLDQAFRVQRVAGALECLTEQRRGDVAFQGNETGRLVR